MSKTGAFNKRRAEKGRNRPNRPERRITVRSVRKTPDLRKLGRAAIALALAEAEAERRAEADANAAKQHGAASTPAGTNNSTAVATSQEIADDE
ncbi:hypothetical protein [Nocardia caishijiensis]|uniref:hypothetical protein n=1 Tax=Nocardia caishijiensis TaxID=184756 RepID=UPI0012ECC017|nr:hypothetical protein [Nocardia caishijiensis]